MGEGKGERLTDLGALPVCIHTALGHAEGLGLAGEKRGGGLRQFAFVSRGRRKFPCSEPFNMEGNSGTG